MCMFVTSQLVLVIQCHANSRLQGLRAANVESVQWLANLALDTDAAFVFVSSTSAISAGAQESEVASDTWLANSTSGYGQSKAVAEARLRHAAQMGLRCSILRLGLIGPPTTIVREDDACNVTDWVASWIRAVYSLKLIPDRGMGSVMILPVNRCAHAVAAVAKKLIADDAFARTLHLVGTVEAGTPLMAVLSDVLGESAPTVPLSAWVDRLQAVGMEGAAGPDALALFGAQKHPLQTGVVGDQLARSALVDEACNVWSPSVGDGYWSAWASAIVRSENRAASNGGAMP